MLFIQNMVLDKLLDFKKINIGGIDVETYVLKFEKDKANRNGSCK